MTQPRIIGERFEVDELIGQGGMGEVRRGRDILTGNPVAIKVLKAEVVQQDESIVERFTREGEALRKLNHPNIVQMLAALEQDGQQYLIMEYVPGGDLYALMQENPQMPVLRVVEIALDLADALTRAHRLKIIHRDIKPPNVLMAEDGTPRLTDFGVAHVDDRTRMTQTGSLIGTYAYLSPEILEDRKIDERADIWAFGVMLFEMLAGWRPFMGNSVSAILHSIMTDPVPDLHEVRPDIPSALADLIERMLIKDRDERISSVRQVGAELEVILRALREGGTGDVKSSRFQTPTPSSAASSDRMTPVVKINHTPVDSESTASMPDLPTTVDRPQQELQSDSFERRNLFPMVSGGLVILAALVGLLVMLNRGDKENEPDTDTEIIQVEPVAPDEFMVLVADLEPIGIDSERDVARFITGDLTTRLEDGLPFSAVRIRRYPAVIRSAESAQQIAESSGATIIVWGNYTPDFVEMEIQPGTLAAFEPVAIDRGIVQKTASLQVRMTDERNQSIAPQILYTLMTLQSAAGDGFESARSIAVLESVSSNPAETIGDGLAPNIQRFTSRFFDDTEEALTYVNAAIDVDRGNPLAYGYRSSAYIRLGRYEEARRDLDTAERLAPADWAMPSFNRANIALIQGDIDAAIGFYDRISEVRPDDWFAYNFRGALHYINRDFEQAKIDYARSLELGPEAVFPYPFLMMLALRDGRITDATGYLNIIVTEYPDSSLSVRMMRAFGADQAMVFGEVFPAFGNLILGQYQEAIQAVENSLAVDDSVPDLYLLRGFAECGLEDYAAAEADFTTALETDSDFAVIYLLRSGVRFAQDNFTGAAEDVIKAQSFDLGEEYAAFIEAGVNGEVTCANFFAYQP